MAIFITSAHQEHMREMDRMMGGFGSFGGFGFGSPFGSPFGMLEGPRDRGERNDHRERGIAPRDRPRDPFQSMFGNMNSMMSQMNRNFVGLRAVFHFCVNYIGSLLYICPQSSSWGLL
jgi:hypothetical protein